MPGSKDSSQAIIARIPFPTPLLAGRLIARYDRFLAEVELDSGEIIMAHCVNTGRMEGLTLPNLRVWVSHQPSPTRKLQYTWEITEVEGVMIGTNTAFPNQAIKHLLQERLLPELSDWELMQPEKKYGENSRIDFWLKRPGGGEVFLEVKNCHLVYPDGGGYFPDSESERASKHLEELMEVVHQGHEAWVLFTGQAATTKFLRPSDIHDPVFAKTARRAGAAGVQFRAIRIEPTPEAMLLRDMILVDLTPYDTERQRQWMTTNRAAAPAWRRRPR